MSGVPQSAAGSAAVRRTGDQCQVRTKLIAIYPRMLPTQRCRRAGKYLSAAGTGPGKVSKRGTRLRLKDRTNIGKVRGWTGERRLELTHGELPLDRDPVPRPLMLVIVRAHDALAGP